MASKMESVIDSVRRIISKWVNTSTPVTEDTVPGVTTILTVDSVNRFEVDDEVMLRNDTLYETELQVKSIIDNTHLELTTPTRYAWLVSDNALLIKTINQNYVRGIYFGDPDNISEFPAITVVGNSRSSEWMTINSTKEKYDIEITVYVEDATQEAGYRFLMNTVDTIQSGLKRNIFPLIDDYNTIAITADVVIGDKFIKVYSTANLVDNMRCYLEDQFNLQENYINKVIDSTTIELAQGACFNFTPSVDPYSVYNPVVVTPTRFIFNSWPAEINYTKVHKGTLLKAAVISWFAEEEELQMMAKQDPQIW